LNRQGQALCRALSRLGSQRPLWADTARAWGRRKPGVSSSEKFHNDPTFLSHNHFREKVGDRGAIGRHGGFFFWGVGGRQPREQRFWVLHRPRARCRRIRADSRQARGHDTAKRRDCCNSGAAGARARSDGKLIYRVMGRPARATSGPFNRGMASSLMRRKNGVAGGQRLEKDAQVLKFTTAGSSLAAVRAAKAKKTRRQPPRPQELGGPATTLTVDSANNEKSMFADGYRNRASIVDSITGD